MISAACEESSEGYDYYLDHQAEIEAEIQANRLENIIEEYGLEIDQRGFIRFGIKNE